METFEGLIVPDLKKGFRDGVEGRILGGEIIINCGDIAPADECPNCNECLLLGTNHAALKRYIQSKGKHTPLNECFNKENNMNISDNILTVFEDSATTAGKVAKRFGSEYGDTTRDLLALKRDKKDLLKIIKDEEDAEKDK